MSKYPVKYINLSSSADAYLKHTIIEEFNNIERERIKRGLPIIRKTIPFGGSFFGHIVSSDIGSKIILFGGSGQLYLTTSGDASGIYDYIKDDITFRSSGSIDDASLDLYGLADGIIVSGDIQHIKPIGGSSAVDLSSGNNYRFIGYNNKIGISLLTNDELDSIATINLQTNSVTELTKINYSGPFSKLPELSKISGDFAYLNYFDNTPIDGTWNAINPLNSCTYNATTGDVWHSFYWVPNIFYAEPGNGVYKVGWYYGKFMGGVYTNNNGAENIYVTFKGFLDYRNRGDIYKYGYAEMLCSEDNLDHKEIFFYLSSSPLTIPTPASYVYASQTSMLYVGTEMRGKENTFVISLPEVFYSGTIGMMFTEENIKVDFWTSPSWSNPDSIMPDKNDAIGVIINDGSNAVLYRFKGYLSKLFETNNYHSHTVSNDGHLVAIFEGSSVIESVSVFSLWHPSGKEYVVKSDIILNRNFLNAAFIPQKEVNESYSYNDNINSASIDTTTSINKTVIGCSKDSQDCISDNIANTGINIISDDSDWEGFYGHVGLQQFGDTEIKIKKLLIADGVKAYTASFLDECMEGKLRYVSAPSYDTIVSITVDEYEYTGTFGSASTYLPFVIGSSISPNRIYFGGISNNGTSYILSPPSVTASGDNVHVTTRTLNKSITIGRDLLGDISYSSYLGEIECGDSFKEETSEDEVVSCIEADDDEKTYECKCSSYTHPLFGEITFDEDEGPCVVYTLSSSCKEKGMYKEQLPKLEGPFGDGVVEINNSVYTASGGHIEESYQWNSGCLESKELDNNGGIKITGTSCCVHSGDRAYTTISATDSCGVTVEKEVREPYGQWVLETDNSSNYASEYCLVINTIISGGSKILYAYVYIGCECFPDYYYGTHCLGHPACTETTTGIGAYNFVSCGYSSPLTLMDSLPGDWVLNAYYDPASMRSCNVCVTNDGRWYYYKGWKGYQYDGVYKSYNWECP